MKKRYREEDDCLNCGTRLEGKYCHSCGQENLHLKEHFGHVLTHAVLDYFHFDHQFIHTLKPLLFEPGRLTSEYVAGRRARFLHPVRMYIFISIVYFLLAFSNNNHVVKVNREGHQITTGQTNVADNTIEYTEDNTSYTVYLTDEEKQKIKKAIKSTFKPSKDSSNIGEISDNQFEDAFLSIFTDRADQIDYDNYQEYLRDQSKLPKSQQDGFWNRYIIKKYITWQNDGVNSQKLFTEGVKHNVPKMMFLLLPLFALILKFAFWRNRKYYVEHLIFSFHFHCFIFLLFICVILLKMVLPVSWTLGIELIELIIITWYIYRAFRTFYQRSRFRVISKMIGVSLMYLVVFCLSITLVAVLTALTSV
ncbi:hypothetical protein DJ568_04565 [Mucilaginibacter hurinus]|uniref:DUF3667 domain-containing protein n=1 Tax=Mucilaginibacter hurinus TaxID=2201324 RepID=A0A367GSF4_9SPHI|nr:DUF3667 domain-containing protein [Mucilaginibacter hurinus]RCH56025.1 hypothetical protein DJ568_04565 [Mucilaginibacter hurinus]